MSQQMRTFNCWAILQPAHDLPGHWVAHCLDLDVVTQGTSVADALDMLGEATAIAIADDLRNGRNPAERNTTPEECRQLLASILRDGEFVPVEQLREEETRAVSAIAVSLNLFVTHLERPEELRSEYPIAVKRSRRPGSGPLRCAL